MTVTRKGKKGTQCSSVYTISAVPEPVNIITLAMCWALPAKYTPGCLLNIHGIYSYGAVCICVRLLNKSMCSCLVGDNSLCICLCRIVFW